VTADELRRYRKLGIPCAINTKNGASRVKTGDQIHVDGCTGTVTTQ
jgi:phosphoenolpyruvate-protein kinase (PTS system EI component)